MKIQSGNLKKVDIPLITPFKTALRTVDKVEDILFFLQAEDGKIGMGEAPPTKAITGETIETIKMALQKYIIPAIVGMDLSDPEPILRKIQKSVPGNNSAKAAADMAVYDLSAKMQNLPLYQMLGNRIENRETLQTDITISVNPIEEMVQDSMIAVERGFQHIKIKVGKEGKKDLIRIREIRNAIGEKIAIRIDANQGWLPDDAVDILREAEKMHLNLEFVEQPVKANDLEGMAYIKKHTETLIVADESVFHPEDARNVFEKEAADMVNIKLMKAGGIYKARTIAKIAEEYGKSCMIGCMLESKVAVSAAAHFAAAFPVIKAIDLDGPSLCAEDPYEGGPIFDGAYITMNHTAGIGITEVCSNNLIEIE